MWPGLGNLGQGGAALEAAILLGGGVVSNFGWWRRMRVDYAEEEILAGSWRLAGVVAVAVGLSWRFMGLSMGVVWLTAAVVWWWWCKRHKWDFWEWWDVIVPTILGWAAVGSLAWGGGRAAYGIGYVVAMGVTWLTARSYRKFKWYTSGKVGLVGLVGIMAWGWAEIVVEMWNSNGIYWGELSIEQWLAAWMVAATIVAIYLRSGRKFSKNLFFFSKQRQRRKIGS